MVILFSAVPLAPGVHRWVPRYVLFCGLEARRTIKSLKGQPDLRGAKQDVTRNLPLGIMLRIALRFYSKGQGPVTKLPMHYAHGIVVSVIIPKKQQNNMPH